MDRSICTILGTEFSIKRARTIKPNDEPFLRILVSAFASLTFVYAVVPKLPNSKIKLLAALPVIYYFFKLPWHFSGMSIRPHLILATWLSNLKLILFCFDAGPLVSFRHNLLQFIAVAGLAVYPRSNDSQSSKNVLPCLTIRRIVVYLALLGVLMKFFAVKDNLHPHPLVLGFSYTLLLYISNDMLISAVAQGVQMSLGVQLETPFDHPYFSTSLSDFWARRWNRIVSKSLHPAVYLPIRTLCLTLTGNKHVARAVAVFATFLTSGIAHEVMLYGMFFAPPTGEWLAFFALHGVLVPIEDGLKLWVGKAGIALPKVVSVVLTLVVLYATAMMLFLAPLIRHELDVKSLSELDDITDGLRRIAVGAGLDKLNVMNMFYD